MLFYMYGCHISYIMYIHVAFGLWPTNKQTETGHRLKLTIGFSQG